MKKIIEYGRIKQPIQTPIREVRCGNCGAVFKSNEFTAEKFDDINSVCWTVTVCPVCKTEVLVYIKRG